MRVEHLNVGDTAYLVVHDHRSTGFNLTVTRVGRKWLYLSGYYGREVAVDIQTGTMKSDITGATLYESKDAYEAFRKRRQAWLTLRGKISQFYGYNMPSGVTAEDIHEAARLLGLNLMDCRDV